MCREQAFSRKILTAREFQRTTSNAGGLLVGYRYHFNRWLSGEANYGYDRDTQKYFSTGGLSRVQSDVKMRYAWAELVNLLWADQKLVLVEPFAERGTGKLLQLRHAQEFFSVPENSRMLSFERDADISKSALNPASRER